MKEGQRQLEEGQEGKRGRGSCERDRCKWGGDRELLLIYHGFGEKEARSGSIIKNNILDILLETCTYSTRLRLAVNHRYKYVIRQGWQIIRK